MSFPWRVVLAAAGLAAFAWLLVALVLGARASQKKAGGSRMHAVGAILMLFGWGNLRDPRNDTVAEARDDRVRRGTHSGEPLDEDQRR